MAQHDLTFEAGVVTVLDQRAADDLIRKVGKLQKKISSGLSSKASEELSALSKQYIASQVMLGKAATTTSARIMFEKRANITGSFAKAATRQGADEAKIAIREGRVLPFAPISDKRISRMRPDMAAASTAYNDMLSSYVAFKQHPSRETQADLLRAVDNIQALVANIGRDRKKNTATLTKIGKDATKIGKEVSGTKSETAAKTGQGAFLGSLLAGMARIVGITSILGAFQKGIGMANQSVQSGEAAILEHALYGNQRALEVTKALANQYNINEKQLAIPLQKALTFHARKIYNQVPESEIRAYSLMGGEIRDAIMSGEAARNPLAFYSAIIDYMKNTDPAAMMQQMQLAGWPLDLASMKEITLDKKALQNEIEQQAYLTTKQKVNALNSRAFRAWFRRQKTGAEAAAGNLIYGWWGSEAARHPESLSPTERKLYYENAYPIDKALLEGRNPGSSEIIANYLKKIGDVARIVDPFSGSSVAALSDVASAHIVHNNQNNFYINGGDSEEVQRTIQDAFEDMNQEGMMNLNNLLKNKRTAR